ncbi:pilus assembly protein [Roseibium aquae]|uniref:Pilus assembly protein n=1 Tax=Roseibium aquae TaxID=1323746 RepID=A0A916X3B3_9HYPH|nr:type II secretion system F family protein [Roseibium aquae]GGB57314.1 pilus assembly protein [Roseibium aquae]
MDAFEYFLSPEITGLAVAVLAAVSVGGLMYALFQPALSGTKRRDERLQSIATQGRTLEQRKKIKDNDRRRKTVQDQLSQFEERQKAKADKQKKLTLRQRLEQAGFEWGAKQFVLFSIGSALVFLVLGYFVSGNLLITLGFGFVGGFGFPRWYIGYKRKRRFSAFLDELPNAVDIIVRGVKAGLPLADCIKVVAKESRDPVATEFRKIVEMQVMGVSLSEAVSRLPERMPLAEANFFAIVVSIQQKAGGGLSEALGNLSRVLRGRKSMQRKIVALSSEAKSSAAIIGSLPFIITLILYFIAPDYIMLLFTTTSGNIILIGSGLWMTIGILVMRQMINFDF